MIFETHAHYDDEAFQEDRHQLLASMADQGVGTIVNISSDMDSCKTSLALAKRYDFVYAAIGVHPSEVQDLNQFDIDWLEEKAHNPKVVAIGEIGLDYHWSDPAPIIQKRWFIRQIDLAKDVKLPIVVHSRDAAEDTMDLIRKTGAYDCGGVIHCYSYSAEMAKEFVEMGFYIGIGGVLTFKNAKKLVKTAETIPLEKIVLETDSPYMAPEPNRGKRNDSSNLIYVADKLAQIKGIDRDQVIRVTRENACRMYGLPLETK
ncbi:MAG: TatD family hydrolase [Eubacterium sp.]|nr:TatD family hydrolase [Eubacterium sp.]